MKTLEGCRWAPRWVSHLGCLKGCLDYLGLEISDGWLYGGTGHAFVINVHEGLCPSGPTAWKTMKLFELGPNLGYRLDGVFGFKAQDDFAQLQQRAWEHVRQAIDQGHPCYGWELEIPEFYVICGYDDVGYTYSGPGCDEGCGPKPWRELGDTGIGVLELYSVSPGEPADDTTTVREALTFALEIASSPEKWIFEGYRAGPEGFDNWIHALESGTASDGGSRYNSAVWLECRENAVAFLQEANERLQRPGVPFDTAIGPYQAVVQGLQKVAEAYPWRDDASDEDLLPVDDRSRAAVQALRDAREAEVAALGALEEILQGL
jgi:hypothetical protein